MSEPDDARRAQIAAHLQQVRERIGAACRSASRDPGEVTLIAVTKTWPASDAAHAYALGVRDLGENKDQEAAPKVAEVGPRSGLRWHFVGQLQTNKARSVATYADVVHAVDRERLARALSAGAERAGRTLEVLVQVNLEAVEHEPAPQSAQSARGGASGQQALALAAYAAGLPGLRVAGVMAVAPRQCDPRAAFDALHAVHLRLLAEHPGARIMSAGMSGDLEHAVAAGATHLRVGTALFGPRSPVLR